jgi:hypothetical protein
VQPPEGHGPELEGSPIVSELIAGGSSTDIAYGLDLGTGSVPNVYVGGGTSSPGL